MASQETIVPVEVQPVPEDRIVGYVSEHVQGCDACRMYDEVLPDFEYFFAYFRTVPEGWELCPFCMRRPKHEVVQRIAEHRAWVERFKAWLLARHPDEGDHDLEWWATHYQDDVVAYGDVVAEEAVG